MMENVRLHLVIFLTTVLRYFYCSIACFCYFHSFTFEGKYLVFYPLHKLYELNNQAKLVHIKINTSIRKK